MPKTLLMLEGAAVLVVSIAAYFHLGGHWPLLALLILAPDLFMLGYAINTRIGGFVYNTAHTYVAPLVLAAAGYGLHTHAAILIALIWSAHIGMDRMLGYGLKYPGSFKDTHLQHV